MALRLDSRLHESARVDENSIEHKVFIIRQLAEPGYFTKKNAFGPETDQRR